MYVDIMRKTKSKCHMGTSLSASHPPLPRPFVLLPLDRLPASRELIIVTSIHATQIRTVERHENRPKRIRDLPYRDEGVLQQTPGQIGQELGDSSKGEAQGAVALEERPGRKHTARDVGDVDPDERVDLAARVAAERGEVGGVLESPERVERVLG